MFFAVRGSSVDTVYNSWSFFFMTVLFFIVSLKPRWILCPITEGALLLDSYVTTEDLAKIVKYPKVVLDLVFSSLILFRAAGEYGLSCIFYFSVN